MTAEAGALLDALAEQDQMSITAWVTQAVIREAKRRKLVIPPPPPSQ